MMHIIFENVINLFQSVVVTVFLMVSLGCKDKYNKKCTGIIGIVITFIYLTVSNHIVFFESAGIYIYMVCSLIFSFLVLGGNVIEKIFYNIMMLCCLAGSALLGGGLISLLIKKDYLNVVGYGMGSRYVSVILIQILLMLFLGFIIKLKALLKEKDNKYMFIMSMIPAISVIVCCFMVYRSDNSYEMNVIYTFIAMAGIIIINVTEIVSNNIVLNYLLNRKINECRNNGIDMGCYVLGNIEGIDDMDLYILLENLCDNAIEAAGQCNNSTIRLQISEDKDKLYIDIGNTTSGNVLKSNPDMNTTKKDKDLHGFGIMNIRDIIDKYNGTINYEGQGDNYLICRCILERVCQ